MLWGVNLSGGEFNPGGTRGINFDYTYPTHAEIDYYAARGMDVIRLPFLWERVQSTQFGSLNGADIARIDNVVDYAASKGLKVDLDLHNYGSGFGHLVGSAETSNAAFADLWGKLAGHFRNDSNVLFGLMNEPHVQSASQWLDSANAAIAAIRSAGATQTILVPGTAWDGAWTWVSSDNDNVIGAGVIDPANNYAFEVHQYFDQWSSGTSTQVMSDTVGAERLVAATQWAEATGQRLFLGEFGAGSDPASLAALKNMLGYMAQHQSAWLGATIWGGGPWWGDYMFSVEPTGLGSSNVTDKPQFTVLSSFANASDATTLISGGTPGSLAHSSLTLAGFQGTEAGDTYVGSDSAESARMLGGDDVVRALGGDDVIYGNLGSDLIYGNLGSDQLFGGQDADTLFAGQGDDLVYGNFAADLIYGNFGQDRLFGGQGNDTIFGGQGDDTLLGGLGDDLLLGNLGADRFVFGANSGRDRIIGFDQRSGDLIDLGGQSYNVRSAFDGSAELLLSGGGAITLAGISAGQVNAGMFG